MAFRDSFKSEDSEKPCIVYVRGADLVFARKDSENDEDEKENELRSQCTLKILSTMDRLANGEGRRTIIILSLSENYLAEEYDEHKGIPFFFASERIDKIISIG